MILSCVSCSLIIIREHHHPLLNPGPGCRCAFMHLNCCWCLFNFFIVDKVITFNIFCADNKKRWQLNLNYNQNYNNARAIISEKFTFIRFERFLANIKKRRQEKESNKKSVTHNRARLYASITGLAATWTFCARPDGSDEQPQSRRGIHCFTVLIHDLFGKISSKSWR